jgi:hypothetical protein
MEAEEPRSPEALEVQEAIRRRAVSAEAERPHREIPEVWARLELEAGVPSQEVSEEVLGPMEALGVRLGVLEEVEKRIQLEEAQEVWKVRVVVLGDLLLQATAGLPKNLSQEPCSGALMS